MGDTANWEFAAAVAAVSIGLGGLLLFTMIGTLGSWRVFHHASRAANEAERASVAVQELARTLAARSAQQLPVIDLNDAAAEMADLRRQADDLIDQQGRLQDAIRSLVESGVMRSHGSNEQLQELENAMRRLEDNLTRIAAAVTNLSQRRE